MIRRRRYCLVISIPTTAIVFGDIALTAMFGSVKVIFANCSRNSASSFSLTSQVNRNLYITWAVARSVVSRSHGTVRVNFFCAGCPSAC